MFVQLEFSACYVALDPGRQEAEPVLVILLQRMTPQAAPPAATPTPLTHTDPSLPLPAPSAATVLQLGQGSQAAAGQQAAGSGPVQGPGAVGGGSGGVQLVSGSQLSSQLTFQLQLSHLALAHATAIITIMTLDGQVLYQNGRSVEYLGFMTGQAAAAGQSLHAPHHLLRRIFAADPLALDALMVATGQGQHSEPSAKLSQFSLIASSPQFDVCEASSPGAKPRARQGAGRVMSQAGSLGRRSLLPNRLLAQRPGPPQPSAALIDQEKGMEGMQRALNLLGRKTGGGQPSVGPAWPGSSPPSTHPSPGPTHSLSLASVSPISGTSPCGKGVGRDSPQGKGEDLLPDAETLAQPYCWHEVQAHLVPHPLGLAGSGGGCAQLLVLVQHDVTQYIEAQLEVKKRRRAPWMFLTVSSLMAP
ncbi:guanylate cyclase domain-containing protein [Haematococcus lacustris]|uniref:Guanylate cyclase domain-containing protein n=1 Tax=Haematococcus lacustris TaxID=44745 RepID=A0A699ZCS1_HAELA|nr:guanylate cyclase domain-containing protein [Haematococcus lacustris]